MKIKQPKQNWFTRFGRRIGMPRYLPEKSIIRCDESGLTVTDYLGNGTTCSIAAKWSEINRAIAYKRDVYAHDLLCIGFSTPAGNFETNENMEGWTALTEMLPVYLPCAPRLEDWWENVLQPPFATNSTVLFSARKQE
jgi:hypothetical protein